MRSLVTGGSGFIGSHLAAYLVSRGDEVSALVRATSQTQFLRDLNVNLVIGDIRDRDSLRPAVRGMDYVFHLGGVISALDRDTYFAVNTQGTRNLLDACLSENPGLRKLVFVSSISAAGPSPCGAALDEDAESRPISDYGRSKLAAEEAVLAASGRLAVTVVRPPNVLGPRQKELVESIKLLRNRIKPLIGRKDSRTSVAAVTDVVRALVLAAEDPRSAGRVFYVTDGRAYSWREITDAVADAVGLGRIHLPVPFAVQYALAAAAEAIARVRKRRPAVSREHVLAARRYCWVYDASRIERELGFHPSMDMKAAVQSAVDAFRAERRSERWPAS
jgi:nucleoside-diphosphate-sugar epimerase